MKTTKIGNACKAALAVTITGSLFAGTAQAQLAGHNVILVHGFQQQDLANPPTNLQAVKNAGETIGVLSGSPGPRPVSTGAVTDALRVVLPSKPMNRCVRSVSKVFAMTFASLFLTLPGISLPGICWKIRHAGFNPRAFNR